MPGTLFVVATPIGNLEDFTFRAVRTLREVDLIAAEDTRRTAKLLAHYDIQKPVISVREHNESRESSRVVSRILAGESVALVSDAGTPGIADPGAGLVAAARAAGIRVVPIPGANAVAVALSATGLPADQFLFLGFPPVSGESRDRWFDEVATSRRTVVFYEAPHRIERTLHDLSVYLVERQIIVCRELTKINEELVDWDKREIKNIGEFVVVVGARAEELSAEPDPVLVAEIFGHIAEHSPLPNDAVLAMVASHFQVSPVRAKNLLKKGKILQKRGQDSPPPV